MKIEQLFISSSNKMLKMKKYLIKERKYIGIIVDGIAVLQI